MKLSAIIITRNEQEEINNCLDNLNFADEIIVVDNQSTDKTVKIAKSSNAKVVSLPGLNFSYLRNVGKEKAKGDWLLYIDADERLSIGLKNEIINILKKKTDYDAFYLIRYNYYLGYPWPKKEAMVRLIKKEALIGWQGTLHETPLVAGILQKLKNPLYHYTHRTLTQMVDKTNEWSQIESQIRYKNNHPMISWWRFPKLMISTFVKSFFQDGGWKIGTAGLIESLYQAVSTFITYAKLWEKQNKYAKT